LSDEIFIKKIEVAQNMDSKRCRLIFDEYPSPKADEAEIGFGCCRSFEVWVVD
jgi:hypothetical protein